MVSPSGDERGFSLLETIVAMAILAAGLLGLIGVFALGMAHLAGSSAGLTAREKAREAIESVHSARDSSFIDWDDIRNQADGGVFLNGPQPLKQAGVDGLINTADDAAALPEISLTPGADGVLGTTDDVKTPMTQYTREIDLSDIPASSNLRELKVTIRFQAGQINRTYVVTTYVSKS